MAFNLYMKLDTSEVEAGVAKVKGEMYKAVAATEAYYSKGSVQAAKFAREAKVAASHAAEIGRLMAAANPFKGMQEQFEREAAIVERIRGPMREYRADMEALDMLFKRGAVSAAEYDTEIQRLIKTYGTMHGPLQQGKLPPPPTQDPGVAERLGGLLTGGQASGLVGAIQGLASGGSLLALARGLESIIEHSHHLHDVYVSITNVARKFTDASRDVNTILREQIALASDLHSGLSATMDTYDAVRDGTDELNLSHGEQLRLTKSLGEAVQIAGKSLGNASGLMARFSYAMASGRIESRELKGIMREVPDIASLWTSHFHVTRQELIRLVAEGKIGVRDLMYAMIEDTEALDGNFAKRERTNAQRKEEWLLNEKLYSQQYGVSEMAGHSAKMWDDMINGDQRRWRDWITEFNESLANMSGQFSKVRRAMERELSESFVHVERQFATLPSRISAAMTQVGRTLGTMNDPWGGLDSHRTGFLQEIATMARIKAPINEAKIELENLRATFAKGGINAEEFRTRYRALVTTINDGRLPDAVKLFEDLSNPTREYALQLGGLNALWRSGAVDAREYNAQLARIAEAYRSANPINFEQLEAERHAITGPRSIGGVDVSLGTDAVGKFGPSMRQAQTAVAAVAKEVREVGAANITGTMFTREYTEELGRQDAIFARVVRPMREYEEQLQAIDALVAQGAVTERQAAVARTQAADALDAANEGLTDTQQLLQQIVGPQKQYNEQLAAAGDLLERGKISSDEYVDAVDRIRLSYLGASDEGKTMGGALESVFLKAKLEAESFNAKLADQLLGNVTQLSDALVTMANDGEMSWSKMVDSMIQDLERLILRQVFMQALGALAPVPALPIGGAGAPVTSPSQVSAAPAYNFGTAPQASTAAPAATAASSVKIVNVLDPALIHAAINTPEGHKTILNVINANQSAVRGFSNGKR